MEIDKIIALQKRLEKTGKDPVVLEAIQSLLDSPQDINRQINVIGSAHICNWLPNRKRVFWESFDINSPEWVKTCIARIYADSWDKYACSALLGCLVKLILSEVKLRSPEVVSIWMWDASDLHISGLGFVKKNGNEFTDYFHTSWDHKSDNETACRVDYVRKLVPLDPSGMRTGNVLNGSCVLLNWIWTELPYGYGYHTEDTDSWKTQFSKMDRQAVHAMKMLEYLNIK